MAYQKGLSGNPTGRPRGALNKRAAIPACLTDSALEQLTVLVAAGDIQAIKVVMDRAFPSLKAITVPGSLDGELLSLKIKAIGELEERLAALESRVGASTL